MACVYVLYSQKSNKFYVGSSRQNTAETRIKAHNAGKTRSTKYGRPWVIIYEKEFDTYTEARKNEIFFQSGQGREYFRKVGRVVYGAGFENQ